jgi:hypothetical protein
MNINLIANLGWHQTFIGQCPLTVSDATCHGSSTGPVVGLVHVMGENCRTHESTMSNFRVPVFPSSSQAIICACRLFLSRKVESFLVTMYVEFASDGDMRSFLLEVYGGCKTKIPRYDTELHGRVHVQIFPVSLLFMYYV